MCHTANFAASFLRNPWETRNDPEKYQQEKARAHRYCAEELTPQIVEEKRGQQELKQRVLGLRQSFRLMRKYERDLGSGRLDAVPAHHQELYDRYLTGDLSRELDALIAQHGYGQLRGRPERLGACGILRASPP